MFSRFLKGIISVFSCLILLGSCGHPASEHRYLIGIDPNWTIANLSGREASVYAFSNELLQEIALAENLNIAIMQMNWDNLMTGLQNHQCDAILSSMQPHIFNEKKYDISMLYLQTGPVLVVPASSKLESLNEMDGKEVAVISESSSIAILQQYKGILVRQYESIPKALEDTASGVIDASVIDLLSAQAYCQDLFQGRLKIAGVPLNQEGLRMISLYGAEHSLIKHFNKGLEKLKKSGEYEKLLKKWELSN